MHKHWKDEKGTQKCSFSFFAETQDYMLLTTSVRA